VPAGQGFPRRNTGAAETLAQPEYLIEVDAVAVTGG
jgi:enamine deaminase RidA (YjgF/YER057c/UK114 family)